MTVVIQINLELLFWILLSKTWKINEKIKLKENKADRNKIKDNETSNL